jgi:hypothetical protein
VFTLLKEADRSQYEMFCKRVLLASLSLRPILSQAGNSTCYPQQQSLPEIVLICKMLELSDDLAASVLSETDRVQLGCDLLTELRNFAFSMRQSADQSTENTSCLINGNIQLLCALSRGHSNVLQVLYEENIVSFLLETCLGLQETDKVDLWSLFQEKMGKTLSYSLLLILAAWRQDVAEEISEKIRRVHLCAIEALRLSEETSSKKASNSGIYYYYIYIYPYSL